MNATKTIKKICKFCKEEFERPNWKQYRRAIFCSKSCHAKYHNNNMDWEKWKETYIPIISKNRKGKCTGRNNPNFGGKYTHDIKIYKKLCIASKKRGQCWTEKNKKEHSERMKSDSNWMRGKHHSKETIEKLSKKIKLQFETGERVPKIHSVNISKAEKDIIKYIKDSGFEIKPRYVIKGTSYIYDMFIPKLNLIIEYNGDYWHCNPIKYKKDYINPSNKISAKNIWKRDLNKKNIALKNGHNFIVIWENEYKRNKYSVIEEILNGKYN